MIWKTQPEEETSCLLCFKLFTESKNPEGAFLKPPSFMSVKKVRVQTYCCSSGRRHVFFFFRAWHFLIFPSFIKVRSYFRGVCVKVRVPQERG